MFKTLFAATATLLLVACVATPQEQLLITTEKREFLYDYDVAGASKAQLFARANDFLAVSFQNSKLISRVEDKERGAVIAKAVSSWMLSTDGLIVTGVPCYSNYDIYFIAKDGRARLQLELVAGAPHPSSCGWTLPPKRDYPQIVDQFNDIDASLGKSLRGEGKLDKLNDF
ncbi:hypothetical protein [Pseudomonas sp. 34 E 7]|uniref:DUF4468 domain-containing protein n=1 Tax=Pseudomonas sp. 34 E 7 TaxID=1844102 RepID=UPI0008129C21|nr:DUF4468 domain-containing protein [Pseudomonas sp. 34 E 7]CRN03863.1 hypothetical protein [Pseudomonas sp. 34 E 7]